LKSHATFNAVVQAIARKFVKMTHRPILIQSALENVILKIKLGDGRELKIKA